MTTSTMGSTSVLSEIEIDPDTGNPRASHIVAPKDGKDGATQCTEARINGTPVKTLCGRQMVPMRDPKAFPLCPECQEIFKSNTGAEDGYRPA